MIEEKIISILLKFPERFESICDQESLFFDHYCKSIFLGMKQLFDDKKKINLNSIYTILPKIDIIKLNKIYDIEISDVNFELYYDSLEVIRLKNKLQIVNNEIKLLTNKEEIVNKIENIIVSYDALEIKTSKLKEIFVRYMEKLNNKDRSNFIDSPIKFFQTYKGYFFIKELVVLAARPNIGKTTYMMNLVNEWSKKYSVGIITTEQTEDILSIKLLSMNSKVQYNNIESYEMTNLETSKTINMMENIIDRKIVYVDKGKINERQIERAVKKMIYENDIQILFIDYLQRLCYTNDRLSEYERISRLTSFLKSLAKDYNLLVIPLAQIKRIDGKEPCMDDLKGSGKIEEDADKIIILHEFKIENELTSIIKCIVAKNKTGPKGNYFCRFEKDICKFIENEKVINE